MKTMIYPYPTLRGGIELKVSEVRADGSRVNLEAPHASDSTIDVQQLVGDDWKELAIDFDIQSQPQSFHDLETDHGSIA
ncbi:MAG: hypothetical protein DWQ29_23015, partial [Planctomycetota bacterium]